MIIFFYGENDFRIKEKTKELKKKFIKELDANSQNIFYLAGESIKASELIEKLRSSSLFSEKRLIIISNLIKNKEVDLLKNFLDFLKNNKIENALDIVVINEENIKKNKKGLLVKVSGGRETPLNKEEQSFFNFLSQGKYAQEFKNLNRAELNSFVKKIFAENELQISPLDIQNIVSWNSENLWLINSEVKKIINFYANKTEKKVRLKDLEDLSSGIFQENIFALTDAISERKKSLALKILEEQYRAGLKEPYIISMLLRQFKILLQIRELLDLNYNLSKITSKLKLHPFIISKGVNQAKNFNLDEIKNILNNLIDIEKKSRQESLNIKASLNLLISKL